MPWPEEYDSYSPTPVFVPSWITRLQEKQEMDQHVAQPSPAPKAPSSAPTFIPSPGRLVVEELAEGDPVLARLSASANSNIIVPRGPQELQPPAVLGRVVELSGNVNYVDLDGQTFSIGDLLLFGHNSGYRVDVGYGAARRRAIILRESEVLARVTWDHNSEPLP